MLNKEDILYPHYLPKNLWYSVDYDLEYQLEFIVLASLVYKGDIEIPGAEKTATNFDQTVLNLDMVDFCTFQTVQEPVALTSRRKTLFALLNLPDLSSELTNRKPCPK